MLGSLYIKRFGLSSPVRRNGGNNSINLGFFVRSIQFLSFTSSSSVEAEEISDRVYESDSEQNTSSSVSFLVRSCGLPLRCAKSICKRIGFESSDQANSVVSFLKNYGFSDSQVSKAIKIHPAILASDCQRCVLPKLKFFESVGFSVNDTVKFISSCPVVLTKSLEDHIIPIRDFIRNLLGEDDTTSKILKNNPWMFFLCSEQRLSRKVFILEEHGVQKHHIAQLVRSFPRIFMCNCSKFEENAKKVAEFGFNPSNVNFIKAFRVLSQVNKSTWDRKIEVYESWGLCEDDIVSAFKKYPLCMAISEKKITSAMEFFVRKLRFDPSCIVKYPPLLFFSLEKRIVPRYTVITVLQSKGILEEKVKDSSLISMGDKRFLSLFVEKYEERVPELLDVFKMKAGAEELKVEKLV